MHTFLSLAFRNIFRNRRRTAMTLLVSAGGVSGLLLAGGFFAFMFQGLRESTIRNGLGHLQVYNAEHFRRDETRALENGLDRHAEIAAKISKHRHVRGVAPRIEFYGMVSNGQKSSVFMGGAVDPSKETLLGFPPNISSGRPLSESTRTSNEALIGAGLARKMNVKPGDGLTLLAVTADGALNGVDIDVVGIVTTGFREMDDRLLTVTLAAAQRLLDSDRITKLVVALESTAHTEVVYADLAPQLGKTITIRKWFELATFYRQARLMFSGIFVFLGAIVLFMVVMSSANTLMMAMFERTREIGAMLAMGTPRSWIVALFVGEAAITGVLAAAAGLLCGNLLGWAVNRAGLMLPPPPGNTVGLPLRVLHEPWLMAGAAVLVVVTLAAASIVPAVRASRRRIVEALAHV